jgi:hypothetical protein
LARINPRQSALKVEMASLETSTNFIGVQLITNYRAEPRPARAREPTVTPNKQSLVFGGTGYNRLHKQMSISCQCLPFQKRGYKMEWHGVGLRRGHPDGIGRSVSETPPGFNFDRQKTMKEVTTYSSGSGDR